MVNQLIQWIIMNQHPFTLAEESNFIKFVHSLNPNAMIPSADTIKRKIISLYKINFQKIQINHSSNNFRSYFFYNWHLDFSFYKGFHILNCTFYWYKMEFKKFNCRFQTNMWFSHWHQYQKCICIKFRIFKSSE